MGVHPFRTKPPTDDQLEALEQVIKAGRPPITDFVVWAPFGNTHMKLMKCLAWVPTGPTTWEHLCMKVPTNFEEWLPCFRIFAIAMEMLGHSRAQPLTSYQEHIRRRNAEFPYHWGVVCAADTCMRSESWGTLQRVTEATLKRGLHAPA